nr:FCD domain-containing protein [Microbacterium pseudoresistens]
MHAYLRESILDGRLAPGSVLSQVALAEQLGVSRTPVREVLRRLQQEGLVEIEPNQRARVARFAPEEVDVQQALRILAESLAVSAGIAAFTQDQHELGRSLLSRMRNARGHDDADDWFEAHAEFHELIVAGAPEQLRRHLRDIADATARERFDRWRSMPRPVQERIDREHELILEAVWLGHDNLAVARLAHHLADSATRSLIARAPGYKPATIAHAERLSAGHQDPAGAVDEDAEAGFDAAAVQSIYVQRIALESLGARMTAEASSAGHALERMADALERMRDFSSGSPTSHWQTAHREFHLAASSALGDDLLHQVDALIGRSRHFMLMHGPENTDAWTMANALHESVFDAIDRADGAGASAAIANDLARPSLSLIGYFAPEFDAKVLRATFAQLSADGSS